MTGYNHPLSDTQLGLEVPDSITDLFASGAPVVPFYTTCNSGLECLSQWQRSHFTIDGQTFVCAEQYMMYEKARLFGDSEMADRILSASEPHDHKRIGQRVRGFDQDTWQSRRCAIVHRGNFAKFSQNAGQKKRLLRSGQTILAEANPKDDIWGVGLSEQDSDIASPRSWRGLNLLGYVLMIVRYRLMQDTAAN